MRAFEDESVPQPSVIIINGGSSAGKTSTCKAFQDLAPEPYFLLGIDLFWFSMPPKEIELQTCSDHYYKWIEETENGQSYFRIIPGLLLNDAMLARYKAMASYLDRGMNVIADEVFWSRDWLLESLYRFAPFRTYYIGMYCDDAEISRREIERGDRYCGWARGSQIYAHLDAQYDFKIDSTSKTPAQCAQLLLEYVAANPEPQAASLMRSMFLDIEETTV